MNMIVIHTNVGDVVESTYPKDDGTQGPVTILKFPIKDRQKVGKGPNAEWKTVSVGFAEAVAYDQLALNWRRFYPKGKAIVVTGKLVEIDQWDRKNSSDGKKGITHKIKGIDGGSATVNLPPRDFTEDEGPVRF